MAKSTSYAFRLRICVKFTCKCLKVSAGVAWASVTVNGVGGATPYTISPNSSTQIDMTSNAAVYITSNTSIQVLIRRIYRQWVSYSTKNFDLPPPPPPPGPTQYQTV